MSRQVEGGEEKYVAYLPTDFAKVGKVVCLKFGEEWRDGWLIDSVGPVRNMTDMDLSREDHKRYEWVLGK